MTRGAGSRRQHRGQSAFPGGPSCISRPTPTMSYWAGCRAIMLALQASGHRIINLACSMGRRRRPGAPQSRGSGVLPTHRVRAIIPSLPAEIGSDDDMDAGTARAGRADRRPRPPRGGGHRLLPSRMTAIRSRGRGAGGAGCPVPLGAEAPAWWMWGLWADLPFPTLIVYFGPGAPAAGPASAGCPRRRAGTKRLPPPRPRPGGGQRRPGPRAGVRLGAPGGRGEFAETATEVVLRDGDWLLGSPRELHPREPLVEPGAPAGLSPGFRSRASRGVSARRAPGRRPQLYK